MKSAFTHRALLAAALALASTVAFAAPVTYKIDPNHTDVVARLCHFGFSHPIANFLPVAGTLVYDCLLYTSRCV